jgi:GTP-binding protein HflX
MPIRLLGNTQGLKASPLRRLERLANRKTHPDKVVSPEFARALTEISNEIQRQVGVLIDRRGHIRSVVVGDAKSVFLPDLSSFRRERYRLCGLRLVHTHLNGEPLNDDDFTDLALLRLDLVAALEVAEEGLPGDLHMAHLLPANDDERPWEVLPKTTVHRLEDDFQEMIAALEDEFARKRAPREAGDKRERAILVHVGAHPRSIAEDSIAELRELARSAGLKVVDEYIQRRSIDPQRVMGKGRLQQTIIKAMQLGAEVLVFDMDLAPTQLHNLAAYTDMKVLDRTQVILDIFAQHATTREGKIQVELAQLRYMLPRLGAKQSASAFSRLTGGIGGRGPGETKLEIDRRRAQDRIAQLEREVKKLGKRRKLRRGVRSRKEVPVVSIVGYTNAGKSTLLNQLTQSEVLAQNALFATLNPVSRRLRFPREREIVITDTVGFIRDLPADLLAAFRTTLEELDESDLLVHVLDASSDQLDRHLETVNKLLHELDLNGKPTLIVLNKSDKCDPEVLESIAERLGGIPVCALDKSTFQPLLDAMEERLWSDESDRFALETSLHE